MDKDLEKLIAERDSYDEASKSFIDSFRFAKLEIGKIEEMKRTEGWKLIEKKIREELEARIMFLVKDDLNIQTLLALLKVTDTNSMSKSLQEEILKIMPE